MLYLVAFIAGVTAMAIVSHYENDFFVKELDKAEAELKELRQTLAARTRAAVTAVGKKV